MSTPLAELIENADEMLNRVTEFSRALHTISEILVGDTSIANSPKKLIEYVAVVRAASLGRHDLGHNVAELIQRVRTDKDNSECRTRTTRPNSRMGKRYRRRQHPHTDSSPQLRRPRKGPK